MDGHTKPKTVICKGAEGCELRVAGYTLRATSISALMDSDRDVKQRRAPACNL